MKTAMPLPVRFLNMVGRSVNTIGFQPLNLSLDKLLQTASDNTGLSDFGEGDFRQPLALLLEGLEKEANLSLLGRIIAKSDLVRTLVTPGKSLSNDTKRVADGNDTNPSIIDTDTKDDRKPKARRNLFGDRDDASKKQRKL